MNTRKIVCILVFLTFILSVTISVASIVKYYGKIEGVADVSCNPNYKWCEGDTAIGCVNGGRTEESCEYGCVGGICEIPTPIPTEIP